jgi:hypothetical protein
VTVKRDQKAVGFIPVQISVGPARPPGSFRYRSRKIERPMTRHHNVDILSVRDHEPVTLRVVVMPVRHQMHGHHESRSRLIRWRHVFEDPVDGF